MIIYLLIALLLGAPAWVIWTFVLPLCLGCKTAVDTLEQHYKRQYKRQNAVHCEYNDSIPESAPNMQLPPPHLAIQKIQQEKNEARIAKLEKRRRNKAWRNYCDSCDIKALERDLAHHKETNSKDSQDFIWLLEREIQFKKHWSPI